MKELIIKKISVSDSRYELSDGAGSDAIHTTPVYAYAVCRLETESKLEGVGLAFTLGTGNNLVCEAIKHLAKHIEGKEINALMSDFGSTFKAMADDPNFRWLGPHKGVVHLALASVTNACYDLWAKSRGLPLWKLLLEISPTELVNTLDLSYLEDELTKEEAINILANTNQTKKDREGILLSGYPGYDTSIGWFNYSDQKVKDNIKKAMDLGFTAMKLKVGSTGMERDLRRAFMVRETAGDEATIMLDVNQQWNLPQAIQMSKSLKEMNPFWIEEPTHPDDLMAHITLAKEISPIKLALGEHVPNKVIFKNFIQSGCMSFNQVDAVRVGGISEFLTISLLSKKYNIPVVPHVGDMGQIHQHLVLFNHIGMGHEALFLEHIPHLKQHFKNPVNIVDGKYKIPQEPGMSADLIKY
ncbi:enolase C-terminal domain-like protein [Aureibaculum sp. 2210JD6-5]|uniref:enolase C-terminal domain-like protein n=1 Tax=Aureibaculum sp. 2210JD6-5 TaxID=3103957 RepID=UPI002AAE2A84|nr:enolase C-terminal domain-like protein [Aureibaculum sp. 2210JD6-5]MDY7394516.1 enolase C-terminal domain-like protein [Aureibaculum sp. 2210JD6-5]